MCALFLGAMLFVAYPLQADHSAKPKFALIDWFPFGWHENGEQKGMFVDITNAIVDELNLEADVILAPVPRVLRGMEVSEYDFTLTYRDPEMMGGVEYLVDVGCLNSAIVSLKRSPVQKFEDMNGMRLAYPGGGYFAVRYAPLLQHDRVEVAQTYIMFRMALRNRLDAFVINDAVWQAYRHDLYPGFKVPAERWEEFSEPLYMEELPLAVSISLKSKHTDVAERLRGVASGPGFTAKLRDIYTNYALPNAMACLANKD